MEGEKNVPTLVTVGVTRQNKDYNIHKKLNKKPNTVYVLWLVVYLQETSIIYRILQHYRRTDIQI